MIISVFLSFKACLFDTAAIIYVNICGRKVYFRVTPSHMLDIRLAIKLTSQCFYCSYVFFSSSIFLLFLFFLHDLKIQDFLDMFIINYNVTLLARFLAFCCLLSIIRVNGVGSQNGKCNSHLKCRGCAKKNNDPNTKWNIGSVHNYNTSLMDTTKFVSFFVLFSRTFV